MAADDEGSKQESREVIMNILQKLFGRRRKYGLPEIAEITEVPPMPAVKPAKLSKIEMTAMHINSQLWCKLCDRQGELMNTINVMNAGGMPSRKLATECIMLVALEVIARNKQDR